MPKVVNKLPLAPIVGTFVAPTSSDRAIKNITFFGDSSITEDSQLFKDVFETAKLLAQAGYCVVNGGGPGVMKAATDGAESVNGETLGVYWEPHLASIFEGKNLSNVTDKSETYSNYMMRTLGLIEKGQVYIVFQGGTGTLSELGMVWALAKLYFGKHKPVILYGSFWPQLITDLQKGLLLDDNELGVLNYATTPTEVVELVNVFEREVATRMHKTYMGDETTFVLAPRADAAYTERMQRLVSMHKARVPNLVTAKQLEEFKTLVQPPARVLDIGAGAGHDLSFLSKYYSVTGVDNDPEAVEISRFENPNADVVQMDIIDYEIQQNVFKGIWARDVLHHLHPMQLDQVFAKLAGGLVPAGILYLIVRAGEGEHEEQDTVAGLQITKYYNLFNEQKIGGLASKYNLEVLKTERQMRSHEWISAVLRKKN